MVMSIAVRLLRVRDPRFRCLIGLVTCFATHDGIPAVARAADGGDIGQRHHRPLVLREGLLDWLNLLVHPIVVGDGLARLFPPDAPTIPLELLNAQTFKTGVLNLSYAPAKDQVSGNGRVIGRRRALRRDTTPLRAIDREEMPPARDTL